MRSRFAAGCCAGSCREAAPYRATANTTLLRLGRRLCPHRPTIFSLNVSERGLLHAAGSRGRTSSSFSPRRGRDARCCSSLRRGPARRSPGSCRAWWSWGRWRLGWRRSTRSTSRRSRRSPSTSPATSRRPSARWGSRSGSRPARATPPSHKRARQIERPPDILLTTPEQLALLLAHREAQAVLLRA